MSRSESVQVGQSGVCLFMYRFVGKYLWCVVAELCSLFEGLHPPQLWEDYANQLPHGGITPTCNQHPFVTGNCHQSCMVAELCSLLCIVLSDLSFASALFALGSYTTVCADVCAWWRSYALATCIMRRRVPRRITPPTAMEGLRQPAVTRGSHQPATDITSRCLGHTASDTHV